MSVGIIVTARVKSNRLYQKVLQKIGVKRTIEILLDHVVNDKFETILAIPKNSDDDILQEIGEAKGVMVYRGEDESPLHRIYNCAKEYDFDTVVRITADDILIDKLLLFAQIKFHLRGGQDYTFMRRCPEGVAGEVIEVSALKKVIDKVGSKPVEFVGYHFKKNYKCMEYYPIGLDYQYPFRLTMDFEEDLTLLRVLFAVLPENFGTLDFLNYLRNNKYLLQINRLPTVTIYTCNYNTGKFIADTMDSVFNQDFQDFEYLILDDNSDDDSMNIITEYLSKLNPKDRDKTKLIRNDKNIGLPACSNKILGLSKGKYIIRVDSDDTLDPTALTKMTEKIKLDNVQAVFSGYHETKSKLTQTSAVLENMFHPACCIMSTWSVNEIKYQENLNYMEGSEFFERFKRDYKFSFIEEPLWNYRQHPDQKTQHPDHPNNKGV